MAKRNRSKRPTKDTPLEVWWSPDGWEWRVLRKWQKNDDKPYARWACFVTSPACPSGEFGDVYVVDIKWGTSWHRAATKQTSPACPDCGEPNELRGHMTCQYPSNIQEEEV
jgi:hypothetical protein